jgi:hypothetical protein
MKFPVTVVMKKAHKRTFRVEVEDATALRVLAQKIMDNWRKGFSFNILQSE